MKVFVFDTSICNGCYNCQIACKDEHVANDWTPYAKPQPDTGQFWLKLNEFVRGTVPKVKMHYLPAMCMHCDNAPCMAACKVEGAIYKRKDGLVIVDPFKCTGCKNCLDACPYKALYFNKDLNIAQKCTGCAHLLDSGWKEPRCVDACPTLALKFMDEDEAKEYIQKAELLKPERRDVDKLRTYYLNLPKRFIAGTIFDPMKKEVIIGATCTLINTKSNKGQAVKTDSFGDFWFEGLADGNYSLKIEAQRFIVKTFDSISTKEDVNLGDIPLYLYSPDTNP
jgi:Fe-S-cluster-containing dehydrogenase component